MHSLGFSSKAQTGLDLVENMGFNWFENEF